VVPTAIRGLSEMRAGRRRWFRSGHLEVRVGEAIRFGPEDSEAAITARLRDEVVRLLGGEEAS
jgi:long-chain acyl-CoA synthetase